MNSDRFKFRAWDTHCNRMRYEEDYAIVPDTGKPHWIHDQELIQGEATQLILMQCTGLKDVEGKLIYEGDILYYRGYKEPIFWASSEKGYDIDGWLCEHFSPINNQCQIIGNIYEGIQE